MENKNQVAGREFSKEYRQTATYRIERWTGQSLRYIILLAVSIAMIFPLLWTLSTSLKTLQQISKPDLELIPTPVVWGNYLDVIQQTPMLLELRNTLIIVVPVVLGCIVTSSLVAYGFARIAFPGRDLLFMVLLATMMLPGVVTLIPQFVIFDRMNLVNTFWPLIIPQIIGHNPFPIFLMRQFFRGFPTELSDAARIDGCNDFGIWWRILLPNSKPVLATVGIFSFQWAWNDFLYPLIYLSGKQTLWTLALGLNALRNMESHVEPLHYLMAMSIMMIIPMLMVFAFGQRYFQRGIVFSGLKG